MKTVIVEDNQNLGNSLCDYLESKNFDVTYFDTFQQAQQSINQFEKIQSTLFLLDINLPDGNGLDLIPPIKEKFAENSKIIIFSAIHDPEVKIESIKLGVDDYMTKPFDLRELMFRIDKLQKVIPAKKEPNHEISIGSLVINFESSYLLDSANNKIHLSKKEGDLLQLFFDNKQSIISRDEIVDKIYDGKENFNYRTIDNILVKFRKWCSSDPNESISFQSLRGKGYGLFIKE